MIEFDQSPDNSLPPFSCCSTHRPQLRQSKWLLLLYGKPVFPVYYYNQLFYAVVYFWGYFVFSLLVFRKFFEPNKCFTLQINSDARDSWLLSVQLFKNNCLLPLELKAELLVVTSPHSLHSPHTSVPRQAPKQIHTVTIDSDKHFVFLSELHI